MRFRSLILLLLAWIVSPDAFATNWKLYPGQSIVLKLGDSASMFDSMFTTRVYCGSREVNCPTFKIFTDTFSPGKNKVTVSECVNISSDLLKEKEKQIKDKVFKECRSQFIDCYPSPTTSRWTQVGSDGSCELLFEVRARPNYNDDYWCR